MKPCVCLLIGCVMERQTVRMVLMKDFAVVRNSIGLILIIFYGVVCHLLLLLIRKQDRWMTGWISIKVKTCKIWTATFGSLTAVSVKINVFWNATPRWVVNILVMLWKSVEPPFQGQAVQEVLDCLTALFLLEMSVTVYHLTWRNIAEDLIQHGRDLLLCHHSELGNIFSQIWYEPPHTHTATQFTLFSF